MAAAYRAADRIHAPLASPLEDVNVAMAHLKVHWPSSLRRLQETFLESSFQSGTNYPTVKPYGRGIDDLIILNVFKTHDHSPSWGLGPSPLSPFYIFYPAPHLLDRSPTSSSSTSPKTPLFPSKRPPSAHNPTSIQFFLDRKDAATSLSSTTACVLFHEDFVTWRLSDARARARHKDDSFLPLPSISRLGFKRAASSGTLRKNFQQLEAGGDTPAARIFVYPTIRAVDQRRLRTLVGLFTSGEAEMPVYTTHEEISGEPGVKVFYEPKNGRTMYWWVWENCSWRVVFDAVERTVVARPGRAPKEEKEEKDTSGWKGKLEAVEEGFKSRFKRTGVNSEIVAGTVKLYSAHQEEEPVAFVELATGQMWVVKGIVLGTLDVAVAVMFAVTNLEMAVKAEYDQRV